MFVNERKFLHKLKNRSNKPFDINHPDHIKVIKAEDTKGSISTWAVKMFYFVLLLFYGN